MRRKARSNQAPVSKVLWNEQATLGNKEVLSVSIPGRVRREHLCTVASLSLSLRIAMVFTASTLPYYFAAPQFSTEHWGYCNYWTLR